jgi:hypothetical protein
MANNIIQFIYQPTLIIDYYEILHHLLITNLQEKPRAVDRATSPVKLSTVGSSEPKIWIV